MGKMRGYVAAAGRDPAAFGFEGAVAVHADKTKWIPQLETWRELGASHVVVRTMSRLGKALSTPEEHLVTMKEYAAEVGLKSA